MERQTPVHQDLIDEIAQLARSMNPTGSLPPEITAETDIIADLKLDSLAAMDFIMALETKFDALIPIDSMAEIRTVGDLASLLESQSSRAAA